MADKRAKSTDKVNNRVSNSKNEILSVPGGGPSTETGRTRISPSNDLRRLSDFRRVTTAAIKFGASSGSPHTSSARSGSNWTNLMARTGSGSLSNVLGGGLLGAGLESLFSGIVDLFGSTSNTPLPLTKFSLPSSQQQTLELSSGGSPASRSDNLATATKASSLSSFATNTNQAVIVSAVKNALLTSSSLNDIIGEL